MPMSNMNSQQLMQMQLHGMDLQPMNMGMSGQTLLPFGANPKLPLTYKHLLLLEQLQSMRLATLCALPDETATCHAHVPIHCLTYATCVEKLGAVPTSVKILPGSRLRALNMLI